MSKFSVPMIKKPNYRSKFLIESMMIGRSLSSIASIFDFLKTDQSFLSGKLNSFDNLFYDDKPLEEIQLTKCQICDLDNLVNFWSKENLYKRYDSIIDDLKELDVKVLFGNKIGYGKHYKKIYVNLIVLKTELDNFLDGVDTFFRDVYNLPQPINIKKNN